LPKTTNYSLKQIKKENISIFTNPNFAFAADLAD